MTFIDDAINYLTQASQEISSTEAQLTNGLASVQSAVNAAVARLSSPPAPIIDCLTLAIPQPNKSCRWTTPLPPADGKIGIYYPKTPHGYPYDIKIMDAIGLREHATENDQLSWDDPAEASSWKSYDAPIYFLPRLYDPSQGLVVLSDLSDLPWTRWLTCSTHQPQSHLGPCMTTFQGPFTDRNWGGDVAASPYYVTHYYYGGDKVNGFKVRENFYWAAPFGWFGWEAQDGSSLTNVWTTRPNYSIHNTIITTNVTPVDPCGIVSKRFF